MWVLPVKGFLKSHILKDSWLLRRLQCTAILLSVTLNCPSSSTITEKWEVINQVLLCTRKSQPVTHQILPKCLTSLFQFVVHWRKEALLFATMPGHTSVFCVSSVFPCQKIIRGIKVLRYKETFGKIKRFILLAPSLDFPKHAYP